MNSIEYNKYTDDNGDLYIVSINYNGGGYMFNIRTEGWNRSSLISKFIRVRYTQDDVEAIINNHFIKIAEWLDNKFNGSTDKFEDVEYTEFQKYRAQVKEWVFEMFEKYPEYIS